VSTEHRLIKAGTAAHATQSTWSILNAIVEGIEHADVRELHEHADVALDTLEDKVARMGDELERIEKLIEDLRSLSSRQTVSGPVHGAASLANVARIRAAHAAAHGGIVALHRRLDGAGVPQDDRIEFLEWCGNRGPLNGGRVDVSQCSADALRSLFERFKAAAR
jgi:hypothetical protein